MSHNNDYSSENTWPELVEREKRASGGVCIKAEAFRRL